MQEDAIEVLFCDLCGASVPVGDESTGAAVRHQGRLVGACCLTVLRSQAPAAVRAGATPAVSPARAAPEGRMLPIAVVLLSAVAAATLFLDHKIATADQQWRKSHDLMQQRHQSDSEVLQALGLAMDAVARKADVEGVNTRVGTEATRLETLHAEVHRRVEAIREDLGTLRQEVRNLSGQTFDYRPLFDDLRQRQLRLQEVVDGMRALAPVAAPAPSPAPVELPPDDGNRLSPALAEQVRKLSAADPATRFEAVDELLRSRNPAVLTSLLPLARDPDGFVRRLTVEGLRDFKRPEAVDALLSAMQDDDSSVRDTAWRSLREVTGQKFPFETTASKDARARAIQKWNDWWEKNKATFGS